MDLKKVLDEMSSIEVDTKGSVKIAPGGSKLEQIIIAVVREALTSTDPKLEIRQKKVLDKIEVKNEEPFDVQIESKGSFYKVALNPENGERSVVASINKTKLETMCKTKDYSGLLALLLKEQF
jgi:hypothetical protein